LLDYCYEQNPDGTYVIDKATGDLMLRNRNTAIDAILSVLKQVYTNIITQNKIRLHPPNCNVILLDQALYKFSRDIYGENRLQARIDQATQLTETPRNNLCKFNDYGIKIDSTSPYFHRQIAVLLYWLSALKPFSIEPSAQTLKVLGLAGKFHNEYISYLLAQSALRLYKLHITVHNNIFEFNEFLYDLHYRKLSRSSLEFFLNKYVELQGVNP
jgi:hypothetical protein